MYGQFGESAGGNSVYNHLAQPASFPFYNKAIIESGVYDQGAMPLSTSELTYQHVLTQTKCTTLACLQHMQALDLLQVVVTLQVLYPGSLQWGPVVDGTF